MIRIVLTVVGVLLAIWLVASVIGAIISTLKFLFFVGLVALVVMALVTFMGRSGRRR
jgi:hypothetical protein